MKKILNEGNLSCSSSGTVKLRFRFRLFNKLRFRFRSVSTSQKVTVPVPVPVPQRFLYICIQTTDLQVNNSPPFDRDLQPTPLVQMFINILSFRSLIFENRWISYKMNWRIGPFQEFCRRQSANFECQNNFL